MTRPTQLAWIASVTWSALAAAPLPAQGHVAGTLWSAAEVLEAFQTLHVKSMPPWMLRDAQGVAIIPHVIKGGFLVGGRFGQGVLFARTPDGGWSGPVFITLAGGSLGWQAGVQSTDVI